LRKEDLKTGMRREAGKPKNAIRQSPKYKWAVEHERERFNLSRKGRKDAGVKGVPF